MTSFVEEDRDLYRAVLLMIKLFLRSYSFIFQGQSLSVLDLLALAADCGIVCNIHSTDFFFKVEIPPVSSLT